MRIYKKGRNDSTASRSFFGRPFALQFGSTSMNSGSMAAQAFVILVSTVIGAGVAFGCSKEAGHTYVLDLSDASTCRFFSSLGSVSQAPNLRDLIQKATRITHGQCETFNLTFEEDQALQAAILRYNHSSNISGEITIKRLSPDAHKSLLEETEAINSDQCGCQRIAFVERVGGLTARLSYNGNCQTDSMCGVIPPAGCFSRVVYEGLSGLGGDTAVALLTGLAVLVTLIAFLAILCRQAFRLIKRKS